MKGLKHYTFNAQRRPQVLQELEEKEFDLIIIGGGITGAGILLDASTRGLSSILIEQKDFASGTSSKSTKLIHGGLRYLKSFEFGIVRSTGRERKIAFNNAPHLVSPKKMILPYSSRGGFSKFGIKLALFLYDHLARVEKKDKRRFLSKEKLCELDANFDVNHIGGAGVYTEYQTNDARLTLEVIKKSLEFGGKAINYIKATSLNIVDDEIKSIDAVDEFSGATFTLKGKQIVNATGPWNDKVRMVEPNQSPKLVLSKGVHLVFSNSSFNLKHATYFPTKDKRMVFAIPKQDCVYVGTTDTLYENKINKCGTEKVDALYLLEAINSFFGSDLKESDIMSSWSGLRPLIKQTGKSTGEISRKDEIFTSPSGLISIAGGKLTGYRLMAEKTVDIVCKNLGINHSCTTDSIKLIGGEFAYPEFVENYRASIRSRLRSLNIDERKADYLVHTYGKQVEDILAHHHKNKEQDIVYSEAWYSLHYDATYNFLDFFERRTGKIWFQSEIVLEELDLISALFQETLGWNHDDLTREKSKLRDRLYELRNFR